MNPACSMTCRARPRPRPCTHLAASLNAVVAVNPFQKPRVQSARQRAHGREINTPRTRTAAQRPTLRERLPADRGVAIR